MSNVGSFIILRSGEGVTSVADPDLHMGQGGNGHLDPDMRGGGPVSKKHVSALQASVWSKNKGGPGPPGPSPGSATEPPSLKVTVLTFLVTNGKMKLSGESIFCEYAKNL